MDIKRLSLTAIFTLLTLSLGLVSANSPLTVKAQNNALSQNGVGAAEQETRQRQAQAPTQDNQIVSGDSTILSGNDILCETVTNTDDVTNIIESCRFESTNNPLPSNDNTAVLVITTILRANCDILDPCPTPDGIVHFSDSDRKGTSVPTTHVRGGSQQFFVTIPVGTQYSIAGTGGSAVDFQYEEGNIQGDCVGKNSCNSIMQPGGASVTVNFHYKRL